MLQCCRHGVVHGDVRVFGMVWCRDCEGRWMKKRKWEVNLMLQAAAKTTKHEQGRSQAGEGALGARAGVSVVWKCGRRVGIGCDENFVYVARAERPYTIHVLSIARWLMSKAALCVARTRKTCDCYQAAQTASFSTRLTKEIGPRASPATDLSALCGDKIDYG